MSGGVTRTWTKLVVQLSGKRQAADKESKHDIFSTQLDKFNMAEGEGFTEYSRFSLLTNEIDGTTLCALSFK